MVRSKLHGVPERSDRLQELGLFLKSVSQVEVCISVIRFQRQGAAEALFRLNKAVLAAQRRA